MKTILMDDDTHHELKVYCATKKYQINALVKKLVLDQIEKDLPMEDLTGGN